MVQGGVRGMTWNLRFGLGEDGSLSAADSARVFSSERNMPYQMLLVYPTGSVDSNQLLFVAAAYNFANFMVKELDLEPIQAGSMSMLAIKGFVNLDEAVQYYKMIYGKDGYAGALSEAVVVLPISDDNYETLMHGKTLDEYIAFFDEHFGEELPELAARWDARMEAAEEEAKAGEAAETERTEEEPSAAGEEREIPAREETGAEERPFVLPDSLFLRPESLDTIAVPEVDTIGVQPVVLPGREEIPGVQAPVEDEGMTLEEVMEIRAREAAEEEARREEARKAFEEKQKADEELRERKAKEREELRERQEEEERALLKAKREREKQLEKERKAKLKQAEADRKAKLKAREELRKEKERAYKQKLKEKEKERKEKERAYKKKLKEREKARKEALKAKEKEARERAKNR